MRLVHAAVAAVCIIVSGVVADPAAAQSVPNFRSDDDLRRFLTDSEGYLVVRAPPPHSPPPPPAPPPPPGAQPATPDAPSITNTQLVGIDEGGIVKVSGEHLVILRRGRVFSVSMADGALEPVDAIDAFAPGADPGHSWYDEMLVVGDMVTVIGFSYSRGGTEINRFRLSPEGRFTFVDSHQLRASDYFSYSNYAARLIGTQLIVYSPLRFSSGTDDVLDSLPGISRWTEGQDEPAFRRIARSQDVYMPRVLQRAGAEYVAMMHVVYRCDLAAVELDCAATMVMGDDYATFFVSHNAAYLWNEVAHEIGEFGFVYRFGHDGGPVTAAQVWEAPLGPLGFHANTEAGRLDLLVAARGSIPQWGDQPTGVALLRLPTSRFGDGSRAPMLSDYQFTPGQGLYHSLITAHRFIGDWAFYSTTTGPGAYYGQPAATMPAQLVAVPIAPGEPVLLDLPDGVARIEQIGRDALAVGGQEEVTFTTLDLSSGSPVLGPRHVQARASQAESRSHAFFFRPDAGGEDGLLGLPILSNQPPEEAWGEWTPHAAMLFLRRQARELSGLGRLEASAQGVRDDGCRVSCVDWYGNARPIFLGDRIFALMGYEIVEGRLEGDGVEEVRRADFAPSVPVAE